MIPTAKKIFIAIFVGGLIFFLKQVFSGEIILPQVFSAFGMNIHFYGMFLAVAALSGWLLARNSAANFGFNRNFADDIVFWIIIGGFLGARLFHILSSAGYYMQNPADVFKVWNGGLSIYGAVFGGLLAILIFNKISNPKSSILNILNWLTPSLILGQIIGRLGNLFNYEVFGYPTDLPWKMFVPETFRPAAFSGFEFFHPWFLYEQVGLLLLFWFLVKVKNRQTRDLFLWYVLLYNIFRFALEFIRIDSNIIFGLRQNALVSAIFALIAFIFIWRYSTKKENIGSTG